MPSSHQQPARLTKKQKKATAFRERGSGKPKGKGKGKPNPSTPGHSRPLTTTGDNGQDGYDDDEDDEDANAIPAMEDQDQAMAAMAGYTYTEGDARGDDSAQSRRAVRLPKKTAMESTSTEAQGERKRASGSSSRAEELGDSAEAQPGPKKKARLARSSKDILPAREEDGDGATSMNDDGDGSKTKSKSKGSNSLRYILFIGNVLPPPTPSEPTIDRAERFALAHQKGTSSTLRHAKQSRSISLHAVRSLSLLIFSLTKRAAAPLTNTNPDPPPTVRLLTPKATRAAGATAAAESKSKSKSKGCAFLEFSARHALQAALRLHQSELDGRRINVELTAGGGGKSDARLEKVKARNKQLGAQRVRPFYYY
jgi:nucleolar protein 6